MIIKDGYLEFEGDVANVEKSLIPHVVIVTITSGDVRLRMDMLRSLLVFDVGDKVSVLISREKPTYIEGKDFVAWGYVMSKKMSRVRETKKDIYKLLISLWGYLVVLETSTPDIHKAFSVMDKVYLKIHKRS